MRLAALLRRLALTAGIGILLLGTLPLLADELQDIDKLISSGQTGPALDKLNAWLANHPKDAQARFKKGIVLTEMGKQAEAIQIFSALTEEFPELPEPYNNLAVIYASQGQYEKARNALELAIHTHPSYGTAHENLGDVYAKLATKSYDKALQLDKSNTTAQAKLTLIKSLFDKTPTAAADARPAAATHADTAPDTGKSAGKTADAGKPAAREPAKPVDAGKSTARDPASEEAADAVRSWAAAWSGKDADSYLAFYASDFKTPNGETRAAWEKLRRERLGKPGTIQVQISDLNVTLTDKNSAQVSFQQKYSSSNLKATNQKTLLLKRNGAKWQIVEERVRG